MRLMMSFIHCEECELFGAVACVWPKACWKLEDRASLALGLDEG